MLYYLGNSDLPSKKAHSIQEMQMCNAFSAVGKKVVYLHNQYKNNKNVSWIDVSNFYGIDNEFEIKTFDRLNINISAIKKTHTLSRSLPQSAYIIKNILFGSIDSKDIIYGRNYGSMFILLRFLSLFPKSDRPKVVFEYHNPEHRFLMNWFFNSDIYLVCITEQLSKYTSKKYGIETGNIIIEPDGVDLNKYQSYSRNEARKIVNIPPRENVIMYTGHLYEGKGVKTLVKAAKNIDALVYVVGGYDEDIKRIKNNVSIPMNVTFTGFVKPSNIPIYQCAADVLVAPYTDRSRWVSPLKLFEYMATNRPIVASDRKVLQEVLSEGHNAMLFEKNNEDDLCKKLKRILRDETLSERISKHAREDVEQYTWENRAKRILLSVNK